ncbi:MAG: succinate dehydrogenase assembly factor 4 [Dongiaceae bacterium]
MQAMNKPDSTASNAPDPVANPAPQPAGGDAAKASNQPPKRPREIGGPSGPEPTRYGDWERNGRVSDF